MRKVAGLDVGGAHLKVSVIADGRPVCADQIMCPLWQGADKLAAALSQADALLSGCEAIGVTMTGELSDLFENRAEGVHRLVTTLQQTFDCPLSFWLGRAGFGSGEEAIARPAEVASMNFVATADVVARHLNAALLIDLGSTTCDIIPIVDGQPSPRGLNDADRLDSSELVYTGLTRTAVMAVTNRARFHNRETALVREYYATMADVRRILGELPEGVDLHATADGRGKSVAESITRLARMFGRDAVEADYETWAAAARSIADQQDRSIAEGYERVVLRHAELREAPIVCAGIGCGIVEKIGARLGRHTETFGSLVRATEACRFMVSACAPAVSVGLLLADELGLSALNAFESPTPSL